MPKWSGEDVKFPYPVQKGVDLNPEKNSAFLFNQWY